MVLPTRYSGRPDEKPSSNIASTFGWRSARSTSRVPDLLVAVLACADIGFLSRSDVSRELCPSPSLQGEGRDGDGICDIRGVREGAHPHSNPLLEGEGFK